MKAKKKVKKKASSKSVIASMTKDFQIQTFDQLLEAPLYSLPFRNHAVQAMTGGFAAGTVNEIAGDSQCGKSFLLYEILSEAIAAGGYCLLTDPERAFRPQFGRKVGLEGSHFFYSRERQIERFFASSRLFIHNVRKVNKTCPIVLSVDSYPPLTFASMAKELAKMTMAKPKKGESEKEKVKGLKGYMQAKKNAILAQFLGDFTAYVEEQNAIFVIVNQGRSKMNVMFGDSRTTNGEGVIQFYCTTRLWGQVGAKIKDDKKVIGRTSHWETIKSRAVAPFKKCTVNVNYKTGVDPLSGFGGLLIDQGLAVKIPKVKIDSGVSYNGKKRRIDSLINKSRKEVFAAIRGEI